MRGSDFSVSRPTNHGPITLGYIEAKDVGLALDAVEDTPQLDRYRAALRNLVLTDYLEFRCMSTARGVERRGSRHLRREERSSRARAVSRRSSTFSATSSRTRRRH